MPPKVKICKEDIINTTINLVRQNGVSSINTREIAKALGCSTQPIFSNFANMKELLLSVVKTASSLYEEYTKKEIDSKKHPIYKAMGIAYINFAKEEKELFKLLFMRDRSNEIVPIDSMDLKPVLDIVEANIGIKNQTAELFHLEIWSYVHGIATMTATNYLELDDNLISQILTDAYQGLKKHYEEKE